MTGSIVFIDSEIGIDDKRIKDLGAVKEDGARFHSPSIREFAAFIAGSDFVCGHNIIRHDLTFIEPVLEAPLQAAAIDTLYLSPLLFPQRPYHALVKDDKLQSDELNNPLSDAQKAQTLFHDEVNAFLALNADKQQIFCCLLYAQAAFQGFFRYMGFNPARMDVTQRIREAYENDICANAEVERMVQHYPVELAYALALIGAEDYHSVTPPWLIRNFPKIENVIKFVRNTSCIEGCSYCRKALNIYYNLKDIFGFDTFRTYNGEPLQEKAAQAAVDGKSLLAVFPTGGGKSITFQLPALMAGHTEHGLTIVISPLQSLMKDQVDNLNDKGLVDAVTVNGLLSPIERAESLERVANGLATLLYISPEQLRSRTIEKLLLSRNVVRFVIDEAHCFSAWGQDFRVDYLYIGDFIRELQQKKGGKQPIPISCFTATAKQKVIRDICEYFQDKLGVHLELFASTATRENLHYAVLYQETEEQKYSTLRALIEAKRCPTIVYVSRTRRTNQLAEKLTSDGYPARPFNGKMDPNEKVANQEAFIRNEVQVIVATSAFGMGVDKKDVSLVIHYDISDSLENYVQEAGRAGRDPSLLADCYVLFNENDLNKHFILLNQTKLSMSEIQQVWKAVKYLTRFRPTVCCSPLEIARQAGWDDSVNDIETRVKTAVAALENGGYVRRGRNMPHVYATSIRAKTMEEASARIDTSRLFTDQQKLSAKRILKSLISSRSMANAGTDEAESRVDYLADTLGIAKSDVVEAVNLLRQEGLLADSMDMSAYILKNDTQNRSAQILERFMKLEQFILESIDEQESCFSLKELNEAALNAGIPHSSVKNIRTIFYFLTIKGYISKHENSFNQQTVVTPTIECAKRIDKFHKRIDLCRYVVESLYTQAETAQDAAVREEEAPVQFAMVGLLQEYLAQPRLDPSQAAASLADLEEALLYLSKIGAMKLEGGFLVLYNGMEITRLIRDNKIRYKVDDYKLMSEYYKQKIQQIHIVGEYASLMVRNYDAALQFVQDYFQLDVKKFIATYFQGERAREIDRNITPEKYRQLFGELSAFQTQIINDADSRYIVVAAGPGSGKTRVLVHKLAALLLLEDVKHEQLLMVTFSRAAATEFKKRLMTLIGNAANFVEIKTFHSYCFDLLGKIGSLDGIKDVVKNAAAMIESGGVEPGRIAKTVLVIDEAQDMDAHEFALVRALMRHNDDMRVIAVGDDDQNIYEFRGSSATYMRSLMEEFGAVRYELTENYRSCKTIVALANAFAHSIRSRIKQADIEAVQAESGRVRIVHHVSDHLEQPMVEQVIETYRGGKACVLTNTNEEALRVLGVLTERGVRAKLIQSMDGFHLCDLAEIRYFFKCIDRQLQTPVISKEIWAYAKNQLKVAYQGSTCLDVCTHLIDDFETTNSYVMYRTDFEEFVRESQYEDCFPDDLETVYVSTIHKSKGREFDSVYLMLDHVALRDDADRRKLYVGITRAKRDLFIHCNTGLFAARIVPGAEYVEDSCTYAEPKAITLQLTHRDVVLDFFKDKKDLILRLRSGMPLTPDSGYLTAGIGGRTIRVAKLSKVCVDRLGTLEGRGYRPLSAEVRFIVAWKGEDDTEEAAVVLANMHLQKNGS